MKVTCGRTLFYLCILLLPTQLGKHFWPPFSYVFGLRVDYLSPTVYVTDIVVLMMAIYVVIDKIKDLRRKVGPTLQSDSVSKHRKVRPLKGVGQKLKISKTYWLFTLFLVINCVFAANPTLAFFKTLKLIELAFIIFYMQHYKPSLRIAVYCLLITVCYSSLLAWLQFGSQASIDGFFWFLGERTFNVTTPGIARIGALGRELLRPYATFPHPNVLAGYLVTTLPLIFAINMKRQLKVPLILFIIATIGITFSRSAWMGLALIGLLLTVKQIPGIIPIVAHFANIYLKNELTNGYTRRKFMYKGYKKTVIIAMLVIIASGLLILRLVNHVTFSAESLTIRNELNGAALAMWRDHPLFGVGLNNFIPMLSSYLRIDTFQSLQPVHNGYLLIVAETGIIGVSLLIYLLCMTSTTLITKFQLRKIGSLGIGNSLDQPACQSLALASAGGLEIRSIRNYAMLSLLIILFLALFDHYFFTLQQPQLLLALIIGYIFSFNTAGKHDILKTNGKKNSSPHSKTH